MKNKRHKALVTLRNLLLLMSMMITGGCGTRQHTPPEIGSGTDDLKASVCEGCKLKPFYRNGQWLIKR